MKWTRDFIRIYDEKFKNKEYPLVFQSLNKKEKILYRGSLSHTSDRLLARDLYNTSPSHQSYQSLKKGLSDKLLDAVSMSQIGHPLQKQKSRLYRKLTAFYILESLGFRKIFIPLARKTFSQLLRNHMFHEAAGLGRFLSNHYAVYESDIKLAKTYNRKVLECIDTYKKEVDIEWAYTQVQCLFLGQNFHENAEEIKNISQKHFPYVKQTGSVRMYAFYYLISYAEKVARHDLKGRESVCRKALDYLNTLSFNQLNMKSVFMFHLINTYLEQNELAKAELIILTFLNENDYKSLQYYRYRELLFRIQLYQAKVEKVNQSFEYLKKNIRKMETVFSKDRLLIYEIYVDILNKRQSNFRRINYNLNRVKQDKKGLHIPLLIGQAVQSLIYTPDKFIDRLDALHQYAYRYLSDDEHKRTRKFIKLLTQIGRNSSIDISLLDQHKDQVSNKAIEMINYETLIKLMQLKYYQNSSKV